MKKLGIIFLLFTSLLVSIGFVLQTDWARKKVERLLIEKATAEGITFETEKIEGTIPFTLLFTNVSASSEEWTVKIEKLQLRLSLFTLFRRSIQLDYVKASNIRINDSIQTDFIGKIALSKKGILTVKGMAHPLQISCKIDLPKALIQGRLSGKIDDLVFDLLIEKQGTNSWEIKKSSFKQKTLTATVQGPLQNLHAKVKETNYQISGKMKIQIASLSPFQGKVQGAWKYQDLLGKGTSDFSWNLNEPLSLSHIDIQTASLSLTGDLAIAPDALITGHADLSIRNLHPFFPSLYGTCISSIDLTVDNGEQRISHVTEGSNLYYHDLFLSSLHAEGSYPSNLFLQGSGLQWKELSLPELRMQILASSKEAYTFALSTFGKWKRPLDIQLSGSLHYQPENLLCTLQQGAGTFYTHPFSLLEPTSFSIGPEWHLSPLKLQMSDGTLFASLDRTQTKANAQLELKQFPIDLLSLNPLNLDIQGTVNLAFDFQETLEKTKASLDLSLTEFAKTKISGTLQGILDDERCSFKITSPLLESEGSFPCRPSLLSRNLEIPDRSLQGTLFFEGQIDPLLDLFDLGLHRFEGDLLANLKIKGTPFAPSLEGTIQLNNGYYENYFTGTQINHIQGLIQAKENRLVLQRFSGLDGKQGDVQATGELLLRPDDFFPFSIKAHLKRFSSVQIDLVSAETEGTLHISGNKLGANIQGTIEIVESDLNIPDKIPRILPNLEVSYKNPIKPFPAPKPPVQNSYPLHLNLRVIAPDSIFIDGRGLLSEWKGDFLLHGTYDAPAMEGTVSLIQGNFSFSGRKFRLTQGALSFSGTPNEMPQIDLTGIMDVSDLSIEAKLKGPLNNPQILLQSTPPLPLSSIMSYLLFGRDLAEINSFQALELASSLASIAGEGPEILEKTRKALGVDRIEIVTQNNSDTDELEQTIALQVGKYVSEGVFVSFTQGAEDASGNIGIEIDLKHGFVLELESDQRQEQGKFTLKWAKSY